jgi:hypothetical protein
MPGAYQENGAVPPKQGSRAQHADFNDEMPF